MIQLEDAGSAVRDHLEQGPHWPNGADKDQHSTASHLKSEALTAEIPHSASEINIKIVDLGVGMSRANIEILKLKWEANI